MIDLTLGVFVTVLVLIRFLTRSRTLLGSLLEHIFNNCHCLPARFSKHQLNLSPRINLRTSLDHLRKNIKKLNYQTQSDSKNDPKVACAFCLLVPWNDSGLHSVPEPSQAPIWVTFGLLSFSFQLESNDWISGIILLFLVPPVLSFSFSFAFS